MHRPKRLPVMLAVCVAGTASAETLRCDYVSPSMNSPETYFHMDGERYLAVTHETLHKGFVTFECESQQLRKCVFVDESENRTTYAVWSLESKKDSSDYFAYSQRQFELNALEAAGYSPTHFFEWSTLATLADGDVNFTAGGGDFVECTSGKLEFVPAWTSEE